MTSYNRVIGETPLPISQMHLDSSEVHLFFHLDDYRFRAIRSPISRSKIAQVHLKTGHRTEGGLSWTDCTE